MPGSKYEREIRFMGREIVRLSTQVDELEAKGNGMTEADKATVAENKATIEQYIARKKEIEDSYIEAGLELPLESRNMNASVYRNGSSFEPEANSYKMKVMEEAKSNTKAYASAGIIDSDNPEELMVELNALSDKISAMERQILEADLSDDLGEKSRLEENLTVLRAHREDVFYKIKELKTKNAKAEVQSESKCEYDDRIDALEKDMGALRNQTSMIRNDMSDMKEALRLIMDRLNIDQDQDQDY